MSIHDGNRTNDPGSLTCEEGNKAMFQHILVPLDGSQRAEQALPAAARLARASGGTVTLLYVPNLRYEYGPYLAQSLTFTESMIEADVAGAKLYLARVAQSESLRGVKTAMEIVAGIPAQVIVVYAQQHANDLIVLCSHGHTGFKRWALGSVAQQIIRHSTIPVLVLREGETLAVEENRPVRALVALDGSSFATQVLKPTVQFVAALSERVPGEIMLTEVVPLPPHDAPIAHQDLAARRHVLQETATYLSHVAEQVLVQSAMNAGVAVAWSIVVSEDVAEAIVETAELGGDIDSDDGYDFIAVATHGRSGLDRLRLGSVTEHILDATKLPLLVVHAVGSQLEKRELVKTPTETMVTVR